MLMHGCKGLLQPGVLNSSTVQNFLSNSLDIQEGMFSAFTLQVQSALLFERATHVVSKWKPGLRHPASCVVCLT
jgi:hypothetical protein